MKSVQDASIDQVWDFLTEHRALDSHTMAVLMTQFFDIKIKPINCPVCSLDEVRRS